MIKKLRRKFILVTMIAVFFVLFIIMFSVNAVNFGKVTSYADNVLNVLYENDGVFPLPDNQLKEDLTKNGITPDEKNEPKQPPKNGMNEETPYETRYFTVRFESDGSVKTDVKNIAAISSEEAISLSENIIASGKKSGYFGIYRYLCDDEGTFVLFVDCSRQLETANDFLSASLIISAIGLSGVFVLSLILSNAAVKPVAESYEKQKRFVTDAGHELKTPLTVISASNELTEITSGETEATKNIAKQVAKMTAMVKNLTALAKLDETERLSEKTVFSLTDALTDLSDTFKTAIERGERTYKSHVESDLYVFGDEKLIRQAFSVIFENVAKYAKSETVLNCVKSGKNVLIELSNDAEGVPDGDLSRCFERFYRTDIARASKTWGSGIGLSIAKSITELNDGTITARGDGGKFKIIITFKSAKRC